MPDLPTRRRPAPGFPASATTPIRAAAPRRARPSPAPSPKPPAGGEIDCLDPGGFGTLTITKSITIDCSGTFGSVLNSGTNGFNINDGGAGTIDVIIRGLALNGGGFSPTPGLIGLNFVSGHSLTLENVIVNGNKGTSGDIGIKFGPTTATTVTSYLFLHNVTIVQNGLNGTGGGLLVMPGAGATARVELNDVRSINNSGYGARVDATASAAGIWVTGEKVQLSGNQTVGITGVATGTNPMNVMIANSVVSNNGTTGIVTAGSGIIFRVGNTTITGNATGVTAASGAVNSYGDNRLDGNTNNGAFTGTVLPKH